ncbi:unnamed protein product [Microthlaspi erraticum]|uniref:Arabidopsis retrotransposon Orf1 C-terminal domain-containing protein n=1 Tax=Microthlaspi erraticum TaxID=1685480 RepID=A0A6D2JP52_9BRAS|nr:unnamed protein product [Microthlaspi erraticum]
MESYKELTCEFLASMRYHMYDELDRADLDQGWDGSRTMEHQGNELQRVWATIAEREYSSSRSKAAQIRSPVLRYVHKALANTFFARKATGQSMKGEVSSLTWESSPSSHAQGMGRDQRRQARRNSCPP